MEERHWGDARRSAGNPAAAAGEGEEMEGGETKGEGAGEGAEESGGYCRSERVGFRYI